MAHLSLCLSVRQTASVPEPCVEGGGEEGQRRPRRAAAHQDGEQGKHDSLMTLAFVYRIILPIIWISFISDCSTSTQSVRPVGPVRLEVKLAMWKKWADETLPSAARRHPRRSKSKWKGGLITVRFRQQMEKQMWLDIPGWPLLLLLPLLLLSIMVMIMPGVFVSALPFVVFLLFLP